MVTKDLFLVCLPPPTPSFLLGSHARHEPLGPYISNVLFGLTQKEVPVLLFLHYPFALCLSICTNAPHPSQECTGLRPRPCCAPAPQHFLMSYFPQHPLSFQSWEVRSDCGILPLQL